MSSGRCHHTFVLEITTVQPLTTGMGTDGNEQLLRTLRFPCYFPPTEDGEGEWITMDVPHVSGQAFKATLREHAFLVMAEALGLEAGSVSRDGLRLILKGGKNDKGETSVSLDDLRNLRALLPILDIFGALDQGQAMPASGQFSDVRPWCESLARAGLIPASGVAFDGGVVEVFPGLPPIPDHMLRSRVEQFRHDLSQTHISHQLMTDQDKTLLIEGRAERKASAKPAKKEERRAVNESMPYTLQAIPPNVPMVALIRLVDATPVAAALLAAATEHWIRTGAHLGSGKSVGRGACRVRVAGSFAVDAQSGVVQVPGSEAALVNTGDDSPYKTALKAHFSERAAEIREVLARVVR
jgi:hypothetical protein